MWNCAGKRVTWTEMPESQNRTSWDLVVYTYTEEQLCNSFISYDFSHGQPRPTTYGGKVTYLVKLSKNWTRWGEIRKSFKKTRNREG